MIQEVQKLLLYLYINVLGCFLFVQGIAETVEKQGPKLLDIYFILSIIIIFVIREIVLTHFKYSVILIDTVLIVYLGSKLGLDFEFLRELKSQYFSPNSHYLNPEFAKKLIEVQTPEDNFTYRNVGSIIILIIIIYSCK